MKTILSLCDYSGVWSQPYVDAGYNVVRVDIKDGADVRLFKKPGYPVHGILAAPPCTHLASSGARWWAKKGKAALLEGMSVVDACIRIIAVCKPVWWALENPVGRLVDYLGKPVMYFQPCDYGDPYTKKTCLWGEFTPPLGLFLETCDLAVDPREGSKMHKMPPSPNRQALRSETPAGFAAAFFLANP